jgi:aspartate/methionine/tyrosine aminotransferase
VDLLEFYSKYYSPNLIDLSSSSAPAEFEPEELESCGDLDYVPPTGADELRELIAADYPELTAENIVLASGASEALVAFAHATLKPSSVVWAARGTYPSFLEAALRIRVELKQTPLPEPHIDVISLCNPSVPDGQLLNPGVFDRCRWLLVDESHLDLVHNYVAPRRAAGISPRTVSVSGISKSLGLGGARLGWLAALDTDLCRRVDREVQLLSGGPSALSVAAATQALRQRDELTARTIAAIKANANAIYRVLEEAGWRSRAADAGITIEAWPPDETPARIDIELYEQGFFLIPCDVYGTPGSYRINLLADPQQLARALAIVTRPARPTRRGGLAALAERVRRTLS